MLLLTAAADPVGDTGLLWRAAGRLGIGTDAGWPAQAAGLIELGLRVRFPHPLVRSAIYVAASPSDCRDVHRALADVTDPVLDPDRRAWHRAHATLAAAQTKRPGSVQGPQEITAPAAEMLAAAARIARGVDVPVTVDAEAGYGMEPAAGTLRDPTRHAEWLRSAARPPTSTIIRS